MRIQRKYRCLDCSHKFSRVFDLEQYGDAGELQDPPCPKCFNQPAAVPHRIAAPSIGGTKGAAVDAAWKIAQEDYGLTNMRDGAKEGETAFIAPAPPKPGPVQPPAVLWGGAAPAGRTVMPGMSAILAQGRGAAALAKAENRSPMQLLHQAKPRLRAIPVNRGG